MATPEPRKWYVVVKRRSGDPAHGAGREEPHEACLSPARCVAGCLASRAAPRAGCRCAGSRVVRCRGRRGPRACGPGLLRWHCAAGVVGEELGEPLGTVLGVVPRRAGRVGPARRGCRRGGCRRLRRGMLVATVTPPSWPAWCDEIWASRSCCLGVEHRVVDAGASRMLDSSSDFSTEMVPTSTGWPASWRSWMSSATASNLAASVL